MKKITRRARGSNLGRTHSRVDGVGLLLGRSVSVIPNLINAKLLHAGGKKQILVVAAMLGWKYAG